MTKKDRYIKTNNYVHECTCTHLLSKIMKQLHAEELALFLKAETRIVETITENEDNDIEKATTKKSN